MFFKLADFTSKYRGQMIIKTYQPWIKSGSQVLDIGCGNGVVSKQIAKSLKIKITGCDVDNYLSEKIDFVQMLKGDQLPFKTNSFEVAMINDVLHHIPRDTQSRLIKEALRVSRAVAIFEVEPTLTGVLADFIINKLHHWKMDIPFTFRTIPTWQSLFRSWGLKTETKKISRPTFYPFCHVAFLLKLTN